MLPPSFVPSDHTVILVDPEGGSRELLNLRLKAQGYRVLATASPAEAAALAMAEPPSALIARLWMPSISGVQLCQLLKHEPATLEVPVLLVGEGYKPRGLFWAERAGADGFVAAGEVGELLRSLARAISSAPRGSGFFTYLGGIDVRDRIAAQLDRTLFDSLLASEIRTLASCDSFGQLFDQLSQLLSRLLSYGWMALAETGGKRAGLHTGPERAEEAVQQARAALQAPDARMSTIVDDDAMANLSCTEPICLPVHFGDAEVARLAMCMPTPDSASRSVLDVVQRELGGALRMASLVETTRRLALYDPLTGAMNRRAFVDQVAEPPFAGRPLALCLLDIDHFKAINDTHGHSGGDQVLRAVGQTLIDLALEIEGQVCRWGGEEFVLIATNQGSDSAQALGERVRRAVELLRIELPSGGEVGVTASVGVAEGLPGAPLQQLVDLADQRMYAAKESGRNAVVAA